MSKERKKKVFTSNWRYRSRGDTPSGNYVLACEGGVKWTADDGAPNPILRKYKSDDFQSAGDSLKNNKGLWDQFADIPADAESWVGTNGFSTGRSEYGVKCWLEEEEDSTTKA